VTIADVDADVAAYFDAEEWEALETRRHQPFGSAARSLLSPMLVLRRGGRIARSASV